MDKNKQIEEMGNEIQKAVNGCASYWSRLIAEHLTTAGYRKASEVAEEVINNALSKIQIMISAIKSQEENGNTTEFNGGAKTALELVFKDLAELKKKYTEGGE